MTRVCLVTTGQPSTNPRLVKEADALAEAGYDVRVIGAFWASWAIDTDKALMRRRAWSFDMLDWRRERGAAAFHARRLRHWLARRAVGTAVERAVPPESVLCRVGPELKAAAAQVPAELYIAHNLAALPAVIHAARRHDARIGFDAEDFHSGQLPPGSTLARFTAAVEARLMPQCHYVTAASPDIAEAYRDRCGIESPMCVLNVFPRADRPSAFRMPTPGDPVRLYWFSQTVGPDRGLESAVRVVARLRQYPLELHVRGMETAGFHTVLRDVARHEGLSPARLHFHEPEAPSDMTRCAATYDIGLAVEPLANVNNDLALSNKIFTYLLAGCAVVATLTRGQARLLPDLGTAAVGCRPGDVDAMAGALEPWLANPTRLLEARRQAWELGESRFNWDVHKSRFLETVAHALAG